ncbi:MAG: ABC transporter permease [Dehalococcoidales bacterium]|nr:ABC transporter permease [Dehalococcoidales bacterium]
MNKTFLIFKHELAITLKRPGFIIMTLSLPVVALLAIIIALIVTSVTGPAVTELTHIGYVDEQGGFDSFTTQNNIQFRAFPTQNEALKAMVEGDIQEYFVIPADYTSTGLINRYTLEKQPAAPESVIGAVKVFLTSNILEGKLPSSTISVIESPLYMITTRLTPSGEIAPEQGGFGNLIIPGIFAFLLIMSLSFTSAYLIQGLGEEKENRLIEVILSSVSTRQLLSGKVLGLGAAGLVQVVVWLVSLPLLLALATAVFGGVFTGIQIPPNFLVLGLVYFILGFGLFAILSTATGALSPSAREGQQLASIYTLIAISPLWFTSALMLFPNSPIWVALTIFPLTAPVVVMFRLGLTDIPAWQLAASIAVMLLFGAGLLFIAVRIFRTYLLMYGKRPGWREIVRNLRNA